VRNELNRIYYFSRQPNVERVIFLGTPHRGSRLSPSFIGRVGAKLIELPAALRAGVEDAMKENPQAWLDMQFKVPTSVELLAPGAPALELLAARPRPPGVHYHSVIGVIADKGPLLNLAVKLGKADPVGDSVVPYDSAHLKNADSELVVNAQHNYIHHHPLAVAEVRRILMEHFEGVTRREGSRPAPLP
jgi:hypothetical protein